MQIYSESVRASLEEGRVVEENVVLLNKKGRVVEQKGRVVEQKGRVFEQIKSNSSK